MSGIAQEAARLKASGALGRSAQLIELFDFLVASAERGLAPKEMEIADRVFGRSTQFDPAQSALVRVHIHRLRTKLDQHYSAAPGPEGMRLSIPKGEYRLVLEKAEGPLVEQSLPANARQPSRSFRVWQIASGVLAILVLVLAGWIAFRPTEPVINSVQAQPIWSALREDPKTTLIIVGDRYLYGERGTGGRPDRLVRSPAITSPDELDEQRMLNPPLAGQLFNSGTWQLPISVATALRHVIPVISNGMTSRQRMRLLPMSQVTPDMIRAANIVYVGHFSDLGLLAEPVFSGSRLKMASDHLGLFDKRTGKRLASTTAETENPTVKHLDFGYIASFPGPSQNRVVIIAGGRDAGLMQVSEMAADADFMQSLSDKVSGNRNFEAVLEVSSLQNINMGSRIALIAPLDTASIWRGDN